MFRMGLDDEFPDVLADGRDPRAHHDNLRRENLG